MSTSTVDLWRLLRTVERRIADAMRANLDPAGVTVEEWAVISLLGDGLGHTMAEVIAASGVPAASATRLVDRMVSNSLLHRTPDAADRRRVLVALAPRGVQLQARLAEGQAQIAGLLGAGLREAGAADLAAALARVADTL